MAVSSYATLRAVSKNAKITVLIITQFQLHTVGAESMGAMGAIAQSRPKSCGGYALKSPQEFC